MRFGYDQAGGLTGGGPVPTQGRNVWQVTSVPSTVCGGGGGSSVGWLHKAIEPGCRQDMAEGGAATTSLETSLLSWGTATTGHLPTGVAAAELVAPPSVVAARCFRIVQSKT